MKKNAAPKRVNKIPALPGRARAANKGDFGKVLIVGGSQGMVGACALAANAALRSGAGLVVVACPRSIQLTVAGLCPCATTIRLAEDDSGRIRPASAILTMNRTGLFEGIAKPNVVAGGPGLGRGDRIFERALTHLWLTLGRLTGAIILDADALNALSPSSSAGRGGWDRIAWPPLIITPHPGEMARLHRKTAADVQSDRLKIAVKTANMMAAGNPVVVLKGAGTIVTNGRDYYVNQTGNPGMATGGTGDVLTGVISALVAQGMSRFDAAVLGVRVHGIAGDLAAKALGQTSLIATDVIEYLPAAFRRVRSR
jgi:NAD(P)H-hydrate epimerase